VEKSEEIEKYSSTALCIWHQNKAFASNLELMHNRNMRTTITLDDDVHEFAAYYARARGLTLSAAIEELIRKAESAREPKPEIRRSPSGFPLLPETGRVITSEMVKKYSEDDFE
jgi:macrodomain Ter protein organizer (MatP/YcbG family)